MLLDPIPTEPIMRWTVHLARQFPARAAVSVAFIALATTIGYFAVGPYAAALVGAALVASLSDFLFPVRYLVSRDRVSCRMLLKSAEIKWTDVKRCYLDDQGVKLSPLDRVSRLEAFRGVYLRFAGNEREVIETVKLLRPDDA
jgi:hypothetical protein